MVERGGEFPKLIRGANADTPRQVAVADGAGGTHQPCNGIGDRSRCQQPQHGDDGKQRGEQNAKQVTAGSTALDNEVARQPDGENTGSLAAKLKWGVKYLIGNTVELVLTDGGRDLDGFENFLRLRW